MYKENINQFEKSVQSRIKSKSKEGETRDGKTPQFPQFHCSSWSLKLYSQTYYWYQSIKVTYQKALVWERGWSWRGTSWVAQGFLPLFISFQIILVRCKKHFYINIQGRIQFTMRTEKPSKFIKTWWNSKCPIVWLDFKCDMEQINVSILKCSKFICLVNNDKSRRLAENGNVPNFTFYGKCPNVKREKKLFVKGKIL